MVKNVEPVKSRGLKMHKEYYVLKMYMKLVLFSTIVIGAMTILNYKMYGEGVGLKLNLNRMGLFLILFF